LSDVIDERQQQTTFLALGEQHLVNMILNELVKMPVENRIQLPNTPVCNLLTNKKVKCGRVIMADDIWISKYIPKE
jgi:hypothetical protein